MKVSYNWLQSFFTTTLPAPEEVAKSLTFHAFEVDSVEPLVSPGHEVDTVFEVKVLADRAHDCLSHLGLARELAAILDLPRPIMRTFSALTHEEPPARTITIEIRDDKHCFRYIGLMMERVTIGQSPTWLVERLAAIGQRSINSVVDAANFVMFDLGQPMHVFDADKIQGKLRLRLAEKGESIVTLDGKEVFLTPEMLVEADEIGPLAIAGIKGGKRAEVTADTKNILIVAGTFQSGNVRQTATRLGLRTDALKRFENGLVPELAFMGIQELSGLLYELCGGSFIKSSRVTDIYPAKREVSTVTFTADQINRLLGLIIAETEMIGLLDRLGITVAANGDTLTATPPIERRDLVCAEDLAEEVGRLYGYEHIPSVPLPAFTNTQTDSSTFTYNNNVREVLVNLGFTETYGYSFVKAGEVELVNPLAIDKAWLRSSLLDTLKEKVNFNLNNLLFDTEAVRLFVIGKVFTGGQETWRLALASTYRVKNKNFAHELAEFIEYFCTGLGIKLAPTEALATPGLMITREDGVNSFYWEIDLAVLASLPRESRPVNLERFLNTPVFKAPSAFPRIIRDVAVWTDPDVTPTTVAAIITAEGGPLCVKGPILFDLFEQKSEGGFVEKKSLAFRLVFQAPDRTLSIEEVNQIMERVVVSLETAGFSVRK